MKQVVEDTSHDYTIKEKIEHIAALFKNIADQKGPVLKLRKKPAKT